MLRLRRLLILATTIGAGVMQVAGCGTTRSSDTTRTATEQLLISDAIDRAVQTMNLQTLSGQTVFLDDSKLSDTVDRNYYVSTLRQQLLANGCELRDKREEAEFVVEARAGAIGTDRNDMLFGLPSMNVPQIPLVQPVPAVIPEIPIAKRKDQRGIAKVAVFAYHRETGTPVWQSGIVRQESSANDVWILGAGPFQHGTIYGGTEFAGTAIGGEASKNDAGPRRLPGVAVSQENLFTAPQRLAKKDTPAPAQKIAVASPQAAAASATPPATPAVPNSTSQPAAPPAANQTAAQPPASTAATAGPAPAATTPGTPATPGAGPANTSAKADAHGSQPVSSAYARIGDAAPLPQPRFNSPQ